MLIGQVWSSIFFKDLSVFVRTAPSSLFYILLRSTPIARCCRCCVSRKWALPSVWHPRFCLKCHLSNTRQSTHTEDTSSIIKTYRLVIRWSATISDSNTGYIMDYRWMQKMPVHSIWIQSTTHCAPKDSLTAKLLQFQMSEHRCS